MSYDKGRSDAMFELDAQAEEELHGVDRGST
jgi:hypothetical protein